MKHLLFGLAFFMGGLGLVLFNKPVAELNKAINDALWEGGSGSLKWYRTINKIVGTVLRIFGLLSIFDVAHLK